MQNELTKKIDPHTKVAIILFFQNKISHSKTFSIKFT